jgi:nitroimidazol reductase NimA-like FMN-containing flavoprotein (pyridoxamine 5'-phosphate oxidase superfamily)
LTIVKFSLKEKEFLSNNECCRLATCHDNIPHIVPVSYIFEDNQFYFATDFETIKYENIIKNNHVALVIDVYDSVDNKAVCIQGTATIIDKGNDFARLYKVFEKRFEWVRIDPWDEGEAPFILVKPTNKVSWGLA